MDTRPVAVVCYAYYARHLPQLARTVSRFLQALPPVVRGPVVVVRAPQLASAALCIVVDGGLRVQAAELPYDGRGWEFGAYQAGLDWLAAQGVRGSVAVFNDTAGVHYPLRRSELAAMARVAHQAAPDEVALMGGLQQRPGLVMHGLPVPAWVRSNAFVLSAAARMALQDRIYVDGEFHAPQVGAQGLQLPPHLSPALRDYIHGWLMSPGREGWRWHAGWAEPPAVVLRGKAGSILLEKWLAARVLAAGGRLLPSQPARPGPLQQLAERAFYWGRRVARWRAAPRLADGRTGTSRA